MEWMILPFRRYADFGGRSRRREFWMFQLLNLIVGAVLIGPFMVDVVTAAVQNPDDEEAMARALLEGGSVLSMAGLAVYGIFVLAALIPSIAVTVRRLHDRDMSGWWYLGLTLASLIPLVGGLASIALLVLLVLPGTDGANRFGPDPKNPFGEDLFA
ncbi:DUF805 domain-containing protein [Erythrobacter sp. WG]|uniref:DUF805 domain-containing protein n=1 Tax=Erythrobacter sp. WG TaxID=2985510 RepID=UPI00226E081A|nr:DUF805 domain-containing protein [Erythrobacter sp. WG]MCX9148465.1 DUF805 domain-containing protein [Erythrobacter sp. WG]